MKNIQSVVDNALCTGCGGCIGVCSRKAIHMRENNGGYLISHIDRDQCVDCGKCLTVCPSIHDREIDDINELIHGNIIAAYIGHARDTKLRFESQSGGVVSSLLMYLLETKKIEGAVATNFNPESNRPIAQFIDSCDQVIKCSGSYYSQSAVCEVAQQHLYKKIACVVLGCQAESLRSLGVNYCPEYLIGLICAGQNSGHMIDELEKEAGCSKNDVISKFRFRYSHPDFGGWPGNVFIVSNKEQYTLDKKKRMQLKPFMESYRCKLCADQMGIYADIVCGDPWGIPGDHTNGDTVVLVHTCKGHELLKKAADEGYIEIESISPQLILKGETVDTRHKRKVFSGYLLCKEKGWVNPYSFSKSIEKEINKSIKHNRQLNDEDIRLSYSRKKMLCNNIKELDDPTQELEAHIMVQNRYKKLKARITLPYYVICKLYSKSVQLLDKLLK